MAIVGWYKLNGNVLDSSGNNKHGSIVGSPTVTNEGPLGICYTFNPATGDYITIPNLSEFIYNSPFTFSAWIKTSGLSGGQTLNGVVSLTYGIGMYLNAGGYLCLRVRFNGSVTGLTSIKTVSDNKWHHICGTYDGTTLKLYIDGLFDSSLNSVTMDNIYSNSGYIGVEANDGSKYKFTGQIADVRIYDEGLSSKEINELSKSKILHYDFNQFQEPTTNVVTNTDLDIGWSKGYCTGILWNDITPPIGVNSPVVSFYDYDADGSAYWYCYGDYAPQIPSTVYTVSLYVKTLDSNFRIKFYTADNVETGRYSSEYVTVPNDGNWHRVVWNSFTNPSNSQSNSLSFHFYFGNAQGENQRTWICAPQMEAKDHATPFVKGSRSGTVYDVSSVGNNAQLVSSTSPTWVSNGPLNKGYYSFKGGEIINKTGHIPLQNHTMSFWFNLHTAHDGNWYNIFMNGNQRNPGIWLGRSWTGLHWNLNSTINYSINPTLELNKWYFVCVTYNNVDQKMKMYIGYDNDTFSLYSEVNMPTSLTASTSGNLYFNSTTANYDLADFRLYTSTLSEEEVKELYSPKVSIDKRGNVFVNSIYENVYVKPILDYTSWVVGTVGTQSGFSQNGDGNSIINGKDPFENMIPLWQTLNNDITSNADGGWNTSTFSVDNTKLYRFSVWVKRNVLGNGNFYLGCNGYGSINGVYSLNGVNNTNPYFYVGSNLFINRLNEWLLVVGYVYPHDYTGTDNHPESGIYQIDGTKIASSITCFKWRPETITAAHRTYLYYSTLPETHQLWCYPRVDVCNGSEPNIGDLLNGIDYEHYRITKGLSSNNLVKKNGPMIVNRISEVGITDGLVAYYPLNGDTKDCSGNANHGALYGPIIASSINGKKCYKFDGVNDYIQLPNDIGYRTQFTACAWFKALGNPTGGYHIILGGVELEISIPTSGFLRTSLYTNARYVDDYSSNLVNGNWHHVVLSFDGSKKRSYVDGIKLGESNVSGTLLYTFNRTIGRYGASTTYYANGLIQDIRIYNKTLTDQEINILYNSSNINNNAIQLEKDNRVYVSCELKEI